MNVKDIKTLDDAQNYVEGCINDYEAGISTKSETLGLLGEYTARLMELWADNVKANPAILGLQHNQQQKA